jgi:ornithine carbamoyltransferase
MTPPHLQTTQTPSKIETTAQTPITKPLSSGKDLLGILDLGDTLSQIIAHALELKAQAKTGPLPQLLSGTAAALVFENPSTRTRVSLELGIARLGGATTTLDAQTSQLGRGESIEDTAGALCGYVDAMVVRAKTHNTLQEFAHHSKVPVINALTDKEHPLQALADIMTMAECFPSGDEDPLSGLKGLTFAWIGDGNNVCHSVLLAAAQAGMHLKVATPPSYAPEKNVLEQVEKLARQNGGSLLLTNDPEEAATGAHVIETDTWRSMGTEQQTLKRLLAFQGYTIDAQIMQLAQPHAVFLHCMPGHWGEEATHAVAHGPQSKIFQEAENRMWTQMAVLVALMEKEG